MARAYGGTRVPAHRSQEAIEKLLGKHGVDTFRWTSTAGHIGLEFRRPSGHGPLGFHMALDYEEERLKAQYLRALYWYVKSQLEAVEFGLVSFERAFMPALITGPNRTLGDDVAQQIKEGSLGVPQLESGE